MSIPLVIESTPDGARYFDIYSRLLEDRMIFLNGEINDAKADLVCAQMFYLEARDPQKDIKFHINSPGGVVTAGLAILDVMKYIRCDVSTLCFGQAASMGALLLSAGTRGKRFALPNARVMIHQPLGGAQGPVTDIHIQTQEILRLRQRLNSILVQCTGKDLSVIEKDTDRDFFLDAEQAKDYGLIDRVLTGKNS